MILGCRHPAHTASPNTIHATQYIYVICVKVNKLCSEHFWGGMRKLSLFRSFLGPPTTTWRRRAGGGFGVGYGRHILNLAMHECYIVKYMIVKRNGNCCDSFEREQQTDLMTLTVLCSCCFFHGKLALHWFPCFCQRLGGKGGGQEVVRVEYISWSDKINNPKLSSPEMFLCLTLKMSFCCILFASDCERWM